MKNILISLFFLMPTAFASSHFACPKSINCGHSQNCQTLNKSIPGFTLTASSKPQAETYTFLNAKNDTTDPKKTGYHHVTCNYVNWLSTGPEQYIYFSSNIYAPEISKKPFKGWSKNFGGYMLCPGSDSCPLMVVA